MILPALKARLTAARLRQLRLGRVIIKDKIFKTVFTLVAAVLITNQQIYK